MAATTLTIPVASAAPFVVDGATAQYSAFSGSRAEHKAPAGGLLLEALPKLKTCNQ